MKSKNKHQHQHSSSNKKQHQNSSVNTEEKNKIKQLLSKYPIPSSCMDRKWLTNNSIPSTTSLLEGNADDDNNGFTILTYNIFAQMYAKRVNTQHLSTDYSVEHSELLTSWPYRRKRLFREIKSYTSNDNDNQQQPAEIICFQECDNYSRYWRKKMNNKLNMYSTFTEKKQKRNGCATFWNTDRFVQVGDHLDLDLSHLSNFIDKGRESNYMFGRRDTANLTLLQCKLSSRYLLVINNHLAWDPEYPQVKLCQMFFTLQQAHKMIQPYVNENHHPVSIVLTGDFNSLPGSEVYNLIVEGQSTVPTNYNLSFNSDCTIFTSSSVINGTHSTATRSKSSSGDKGEGGQILLNPFGKFKSCYSEMNNGKEPLFTNYNDGFSGTLDYIFTLDIKPVLENTPPKSNGGGELVCLKVLEAISEERASEFKCLPSPIFPSDHIPMCARLVWQ